MIGIYVHIPFCTSICSYCDFTKRVTLKENRKKEYLEKVKEEIDHSLIDINSIDTIYIGGGTPNSLSLDLLEYLLKLLDKFVGPNLKEYTIECNPDLITVSMVKLFLSHHINRISFGVQSFHEKSLLLLNRKHTKDQVQNSIHICKDQGLSNISIDLLTDIPGETVEDVNQSLESFYQLDIPHVSIYSLILEEHTQLSYWVNKNQIQLNSEEESSLQYEQARNSLEAHGYHQYEISNYAKPGFSSIHNLKYWEEKEYVGFGVSACSFKENKRIEHTRNLMEYMNDPIGSISFEEMSLPEQCKESILLGLRKTEGISIVETEERYQINFFETFPFVKQFILEKYLFIDNDHRLKFTKRGMECGNQVFMAFVGDQDD